jgi:transposase
MRRGDLTDGEGERLRPLLPVGNGRCGRWCDHRQVIDGILHRVRTGVQWRDLPERFGPWRTVCERHRLWSADGTWERLLQQAQAAADAADEVDRDISADFTIVRRAINRLQRSRAVAARYDKRGMTHAAGHTWPVISAFRCLTVGASSVCRSAGDGPVCAVGIRRPVGTGAGSSPVRINSAPQTNSPDTTVT